MVLRDHDLLAQYFSLEFTKFREFFGVAVRQSDISPGLSLASRQ